MCRLVAHEARPFFQHDHPITFTYHANTARDLTPEMTDTYSNWMYVMGSVIHVLYKAPCQGLSAEAWDDLLQFSRRDGNGHGTILDLPTMDTFFCKSLRQLRNTCKIRHRLELRLKGGVGLSLEHDVAELLADIGLRPNEPEYGMSTAVTLQLLLGEDKYKYYYEVIAGTSPPRTRKQGIWSIEPLK